MTAAKKKSIFAFNFDIRTIVGVGLLTAIVLVLQLFIGSTIRLGTFSVSLVLMPIVIGAALFGFWAGAWLGLVFGIAVLLSGDAALFMGINPLGTIITVILKGLLAGAVSGLVYTLLADLFSRNNSTERFATIAACCLMILGGAACLGYGIHLINTPVVAKALAESSKSQPGTFCIVFGGILAAVGIALLIYVLIKKPDLDVSAAVFVSAAVCPIVNTGIFLIGCRLFFYETVKEWAGGSNVGVFMIVGLVGFNFILELAINLILSPAIVMLINYGRKSIAK